MTSWRNMTLYDSEITSRLQMAAILDDSPFWIFICENESFKSKLNRTMLSDFKFSFPSRCLGKLKALPSSRSNFVVFFLTSFYYFTYSFGSFFHLGCWVGKRSYSPPFRRLDDTYHRSCRGWTCTVSGDRNNSYVEK